MYPTDYLYLHQPRGCRDFLPLDQAVIVREVRDTHHTNPIYGAWYHGRSREERFASVDHLLWSFLASICKRSLSMPVKKTSYPDAKTLLWVNVTRTEGDKREIAKRDYPDGEVLAWFGALAYEGCKSTLSWDRYSESCQIALIVADPEHPDYGYAISGRHPDVDVACRTLYYKVTKLCPNGLKAAHSPNGAKESWS